MKKNSLLILFLISTMVSAQFDNSFGIKAGANYSQFTPDMVIQDFNTLDYQGKFGYYIGAFYSFQLSEKFSVQPEILFANQGTRQVFEGISFRPSPSEPEIIGNVETNLNEFSVLLPIIVRFSLNEKVFLEAGPQVSYSFKRTEIIKKNPFDPSSEGEEATDSPNTSDFDEIDAGLNLGLGLNLTERLELNLRYTLGIIERDENYKTSVFNLGLGFRI